MDLETIIKQNRMAGAKLVAAANQCVDGIEVMKKLFSFHGNDCALVNPANNQDLNIDRMDDPQSRNDKIID